MGKSPTTTSLTGANVVEAIRKKLGASSLTALAGLLGITNQAVQNWKNRKAITARQIAGLVQRAQESAQLHAEWTAVRPLVEFFPIKKTPTKQNAGFEVFSTHDGSKIGHPYLQGLRNELEDHHGVYVFFDSRGQAIYAGKARKLRLWREINNAFNRKRQDLQKIRRVAHPSRRNKYATSDEKRRQIIEIPVPLHELAYYFSAYDVADGMINVVETMLVRSFANNLLNKRMERFAPPKKAKKKTQAQPRRRKATR